MPETRKKEENVQIEITVGWLSYENGAISFIHLED
jgi:hypothetical protein